MFFGVISLKPVFCGGGSSRAHISQVVLQHSGRQYSSPSPVGRASMLDGFRSSDGAAVRLPQVVEVVVS